MVWPMALLCQHAGRSVRYLRTVSSHRIYIDSHNVGHTGVTMSVVNTLVNLPRRSRLEQVLADCRNQIKALQNLTYLASLDTISDSVQQLNLAMMETRLHLLSDMLTLPA